jgi:hypothetical protein
MYFLLNQRVPVLIISQLAVVAGVLLTLTTRKLAGAAAAPRESEAWPGL